MENNKKLIGSQIGGFVLIALGLCFLAGQFLRLDIWHYLWPFFIVGLGSLFFVGMFLGGKPAGALAIPGTILTLLGLLFVYQNTFDAWESWAYAWTLLAPTGVGLGLMIFARWSDKPELKQPGWILIVIGLIMFVVMGAFFELLLGFGRYDVAGRILWPVLLIGLGVVMLFGGLFRRLITTPTSTSSTPAEPPSPLPGHTTGGPA